MREKKISENNTVLIGNFTDCGLFKGQFECPTLPPEIVEPQINEIEKEFIVNLQLNFDQFCLKRFESGICEIDSLFNDESSCWTTGILGYMLLTLGKQVPFE